MEKISFEQAIKKLEQIVSKMEEGNLSLEESLELFEEGIKLTKFCEKKLEEAKEKIEILSSDSKGNLTARPLKKETIKGENNKETENNKEDNLF